MIIIPVHTPALKMPSIAEQLLNNKIAGKNKINAVRKFRCFIKFDL